MTQAKFYGTGFPYHQIKDMPGKLIVLEGTDSVGRSTQITLIKKWLESEGYAVSDTGLNRSLLTQQGLEQAKEGHTLGKQTLSLFYATDFADRLENQILPALKAGFYVLSDRYFYSVIARDEIRGADPVRECAIYGFALKPDIIIYLKADVPTLVSRMVHGRGFNHWESGMDIRCSDNLYDSFCSYQSSLINEFDKMAEEYQFQTVDANQPFQDVFNEIKTLIRPLLVKE